MQVPLNTRLRTRDVAYVLSQSDSAMLITHDVSGPIDYLGMVREVVAFPETGTTIRDERFPALRQVVILGEEAHPGTVAWADLLSRGATVSTHRLARRASGVFFEDPVFIMYTSGTTGAPKGVVHSHKLVRNIEDRGFRMAITPNDTILNYLPLFHAFGFSEGMMMSVLTGARQILTETFDPDECLDLIEAEGVTIAHGFEAHMKGLSEAHEARPRNLSTLRTGI